ETERMWSFMRKKNVKVVVTLTLEEVRFIRDVIMEKRNELLRRGGPTEDLDAILIKLLKA
ncbi:MAG: hypothetical protein IKF90_21685, partial [Parasporobacterium sp.]|nr:hypothetical protein [Parasporobacterium sp.]